MAAPLALGIGQLEGKSGDAAKQELRAGVEALAKCLGPVAGMFEEGAVIDNTLPLRADVKQLSLLVFERLLGSDALQLQLENEAYALVRAWVYQSPHARRSPYRHGLFHGLAPLLRYHHMTHNFLVNVVCRCPLMEESGLLIPVVRRAFVQRDFSPSILQRVQVEQGPTNSGVTRRLICMKFRIRPEFPRLARDNERTHEGRRSFVEGGTRGEHHSCSWRAPCRLSNVN